MSIKVQNTPNRAAFDVQSSHDIRAQFQKDPKAGLQAAAQQFEALFMQMVMKSMRDATPQDGLLNSDQSRFYTSLLDQQMAQHLASSGKGVGFDGHTALLQRALRETLNNWLRGRIAALRGARSLAYLLDMSRSLRSVRLALHPARSFLQRLPSRLRRGRVPLPAAAGRFRGSCCSGSR